MKRGYCIAWMALAIVSAIVVPLRVAEIAAAHQLKRSICVVAANDASLPAIAVSHTNMNTGNLKDE